MVTGTHRPSGLQRIASRKNCSGEDPQLLIQKARNLPRSRQSSYHHTVARMTISSIPIDGENSTPKSLPGRCRHTSPRILIHTSIMTMIRHG